MPAKTKQTRRPKINEAAKMDEVAKKTGISISALRLHQRAGVNIYDDDELREHIQKTGNRTRSLNMEWLGVEPAPENADIQTLKDELTRTIDRNVAQRIKTQIDGLLKVNGGAEFTQSVTADTTLNVLGLTTLSSLVITNISAGATSEVVYWDAGTGKLAHAPAANIGLTPANTFVVAENGNDSTGDGSFISPYKTIQFAISQCSAGAQDNGQTIWIMAGPFVENPTNSDKNIKFKGSGDTQNT